MRPTKLGLITLALVGLMCFLTGPVRAQDKDVEKVKFDTVDGVTLQGLFYPSKKGKKAPTVMLLHKIGGSSVQDGWDKLALDLQEKGMAVLIFDFRGHGNSTAVAPIFWTDKENNSLVVGGGGAKPKESISFKDMDKRYYPVLINDITAAKMYLDKRNDGNDCNSSNLVLIGAEEGATLGMMWLYAEQFRYRLTSYNDFTGVYTKDNNSEGTRVAAAIWLSISPTLGGANYGDKIKYWVNYTGQEKNVPMAFVYGAKNPGDADTATKLHKLALDKGTKNKWTGERGIKETDGRGHSLLSDKVEGRSWIVGSYLKTLFDPIDGKPLPVHEERDNKKYGYIWELPMKAPIFAKVPGFDPLNKVPVGVLLQ